MIGNDLVYQPGMILASGNRFDRYLNKAYLPDEQTFIRNHADPIFAISWLWALKESAYKVWAKRTGMRKWNPKDFEILNFPEKDFKIAFSDKKEGFGFQDCDFFSADIQTSIGQIRGKITSFSDYVIAFVSDQEEELENIYWGIKTANDGNLSKIVKQFLFEKLEEEGICFNKFSFSSSSNGIPQVSTPNHSFDISFTHDRQMISYAFIMNQTLENEYRTIKRKTQS